MTMRLVLVVITSLLAACGGGIDTPDEVEYKPECTLAQVYVDGYVTCN